MKKVALSLLLALLGVFCLGAAAQAVIPQEYDLIILNLPDGSQDSDSEANAISGSLIAGSYHYSGRPICWDNKNSFWPIPVEYGYGKALGTDGHVVVGEADNAVGWTRAFYHGGEAEVQYLGYLPGLYDSVAYMYNTFNDFAVGCSYDHYTPASAQACIFRRDDQKTTTALSPGKHSIAYAANNSKIAGWEKSDRTGGNQHAVLWNHDGGGWQDLTPQAGSAAALAINSDGVVTGYMGTQAFVWDTINGLRPIQSSAKGQAINVWGQVVGSYDGSGSWPVAFIWEEGQGTVLLNSLAKNRKGFEIAEARGIDDHGHIVGWGYYPASQPVRRAFVLRPMDPPPINIINYGPIMLLLD